MNLCSVKFIDRQNVVLVKQLHLHSVQPVQSSGTGTGTGIWINVQQNHENIWSHFILLTWLFNS